MQDSLENALDKLISPRSSAKSQKDALDSLEYTLAELLFRKRHLEHSNLKTFLQLQSSFQCNLASRIHSWLAYRTEALKKLADQKSWSADDCEEEFVSAVALIVQALSLLQGVALLHKRSKEFLCRIYSLETFVDLLSICRHASAKSFASSTNTSPLKSSKSSDQYWHSPLVSAVLDTLLCILVDSSSALRCFEEARGIEHVVKILKRSAIPKDVRIKCLEFLYFYLMDESPSYLPISVEKYTGNASSNLFTLGTGNECSRLSTTSSWRSNSSESHSSNSGSSSWSATPTLAGTPPLLPKPLESDVLPRTKSTLDMLRKDVDFVPISPKRPKVAQVEGGARHPRSPGLPSPLIVPVASNRVNTGHPSPLGRLAAEETLQSDSDSMIGARGNRKLAQLEGKDIPKLPNAYVNPVRFRTMEEKKEILGQLLGNVDALVEGVKKAGIWG